MSIFHPTPVACRCGRQFMAPLVHSANIQRMPALRTAILDGSFHRVTCPACGNIANVESVFTYTDTERRQLFLVFPRNARFRYQAHGQVLRKLATKYTPLLFKAKTGGGSQKSAAAPPVLQRIVYGLDELREKLVVHEGGYDDRAVEYLKARLLAAHPFLTQTNRVQLVMHQKTTGHLKFLAYHHNRAGLYQLTLPRSIADRTVKGISQWLKAPKSSPLHPLPPPAPDAVAPPVPTTPPPDTGLDDFWVNFRNWTGRYDSTQVLNALANDISAGNKPPLTGTDFDAMMAALPRGADLSTASKQDLDTVFTYAKNSGNTNVELNLLAVRFGKTLGNEWFQNINDTSDIPVLWQVLHDLPPDDVEGNVNLSEIDLNDTSGGSYTATGGLIQMGTDLLGSLPQFQETLRHEVGHSVNIEFNPGVDTWVQSRFGWKMLPSGQDDWTGAITAWVAAMGGWGPANATEQADIANFLQNCLTQSAGNWTAALTPPFAAGHAWFNTACLPAQAYQQSLSQVPNQYWYDVCATWITANGNSFAVNFYYGQLMQVSTATITKYVLNMPDPDHYAAMSQPEFFAELYAFYFDSTSNAKTVLEPDVLSWLNDNITTLKKP